MVKGNSGVAHITKGAFPFRKCPFNVCAPYRDTSRTENIKPRKNTEKLFKLIQNKEFYGKDEYL